MAFLSELRTVLGWVSPFVWIAYGIVVLVRRRHEDSVRQLTRATALGVGIAFVLCAALFASTFLI